MTKDKKNSFEIAYEEALNLACNELIRKDVHSCCINAGAEVLSSSEKSFNIKITFLNKDVYVDIPEFVFSAGSSDPLHVWEKILILHYLSNARTIRMTNSLINYRQVRDGANYFPAFEKRSTKPFLNTFGTHPESMIRASQALGGEEVRQGDAGVKVTALPFVPVYFVIWKGDAEFPPSGNILFDSSIEKFLSAEDIAVLCQQIVFKMIKARGQ